MGTKKITELTELSGPAGDDLLALVDATDTTTKKITLTNLIAALLAAPPAIGGTTPAAGSFTTLSATGLTDLSAAGAGQIKFPASQNASADPNTLDDYEEGTWTPAINGSVLAPSDIAYDVQSGVYTKIGKQVTINFALTGTITGAGIGAFQVSGLPFQPAHFGCAKILSAYLPLNCCAYLDTSAPKLAFYREVAGAGPALVSWGDTDVSSAAFYVLGTLSFLV
jgi:hypothetical protein